MPDNEKKAFNIMCVLWVVTILLVIAAVYKHNPFYIIAWVSIVGLLAAGAHLDYTVWKNWKDKQ